MFYNLAGYIVRFLLAVFTRTTVEGVERVPGSGALLLVSNHLNLIDPPVLGALLPRRIIFMAKEELYRVPVVGSVVRWYGAFAIRRGEVDRQALRTAVDVLKAGNVLGIFPEGHRSPTGKMIEARAGASLLATMSGAMVLPVSIDGTDHVKSPLSLLRRPRIHVRVGEPFMVIREKSGKGSLDNATREMMCHVAALLPEERRGVYGETVCDGEREGRRSEPTSAEGLRPHPNPLPEGEGMEDSPLTEALGEESTIPSPHGRGLG